MEASNSKEEDSGNTKTEGSKHEEGQKETVSQMMNIEQDKPIEATEQVDDCNEFTVNFDATAKNSFLSKDSIADLNTSEQQTPAEFDTEDKIGGQRLSIELAQPMAI